MSDNENLDIQREKLKLDKQCLQFEMGARESANKIDSERILLERSKERTSKLQLILPLLISAFAIGLSLWTATLQYRLQYVVAVSSYNTTRLELLKRLSERAPDNAEVKKIYAEVFPNDSKALEKEQKTLAAVDK